MNEGFEKLVQHAQEGDQEAMEKLLIDYGYAIRREIRFSLLDLRLRRVVDEYDVFQIVVSKFATSLTNGHFHFDTPSDLVSLLKVMARTQVACQARFWHAQCRDLRKNVVIDSVTETCTVGSTGSLAIELIELLELALTHLKDRDRQILDWRQDDVTWLEIASRLNAPSSEALRKQHERTLARVAQQVDPDNCLARYPR